MLTLNGEIGSFVIDPQGRSTFSMNMEPATLVFNEVALQKSNVVANAVGLYSFVPVGRYGRARMLGLGTPKYLLQGRKNCLTWNPKGTISMSADEIQAHPVEFMGTQCADDFFGKCFEYITGTGNQANDLFSTPEGNLMLGAALDNIYLGLGNSVFELVTFGNAPLIAQSNAGNWWNKEYLTTGEWADFIDQQTSVGVTGHSPLMEAAKAEGLANFNVTLPSNNFSGALYTGSDITAEFDKVIAASKTRFRVLVKQRAQDNVVMAVTKSVFDAYKSHLIDTYGASGIPAAYLLVVDGEPVPGVLRYDGIPVVCMDEWTEHDEVLGINTHRILLTAKGNLSIAHDVASIDQFGGMGLRVEQSPILRDKGRIDMYTAFQVGAGIANTDFMVNASLVLTP